MSSRGLFSGFRHGTSCLLGTVLAFSGLSGISIESRAAAMELEEILVTAQRRDESRQDVNASLTALAGESLVESAIQDVTDLPLYVPGLIISQIAASQISIRGISTQAQSVGGDPGVASYKDDIYLSRPGMAYVSFFDTERVEVLRGPQGTLYGRNTTGGVLHIISRKPEEELGGYLIGQYGRFDKRRFEGAVNLPVSEELRSGQQGSTTSATVTCAISTTASASAMPMNTRFASPASGPARTPRPCCSTNTPRRTA